MKFRIARHTTDLNRIIDFYKSVVGLQVLGSFSDHEGYNGVFIGLPACDWHLEFTTSAEQPNHIPDDDDLLVFYVADRVKQREIAERCEVTDIQTIPAKNPYWKQHGLTLTDPDGYKIVIAVADGF